MNAPVAPCAFPPAPRPERPSFAQLMERARREMLALAEAGEMDPEQVTAGAIAQWATDMDPE